MRITGGRGTLPGLSKVHAESPQGSHFPAIGLYHWTGKWEARATITLQDHPGRRRRRTTIGS
jgi:hypothetical protein